MRESVRLDLMRHGETKGGSGFVGCTNYPLSERGWEQMWLSVEGRDGWKQIVTSPLSRCTDFAYALSRHYATPVRIEDRFSEINFGAWEGRTARQVMLTQAEALNRYWYNPVQYTPPDGESLTMFASRVLSAWSDILAEQQSDNTLIIAHGGVIRVILCHVWQHPLQRLLDFDVRYSEINSIYVENIKSGSS